MWSECDGRSFNIFSSFIIQFQWMFFLHPVSIGMGILIMQVR
jgi:hypothetical protein